MRKELMPLIEEAKTLKDEARIGKMKTLHQNADSLEQSFNAVCKKLELFSN
ncbi:MAG: hypothetical protein ACXWPX_07930 [Pseudobdellovibrio sp.]